MSNTITPDISTVDALWAIIQTQTQSVKDALYHRMMEADQLRKMHQQEDIVSDSLRRALTELHDARLSQKKLPNARDLFQQMDTE